MGNFVELRGLGFTMSKDYKSLRGRGLAPLMLAAVVFVLCPSWQGWTTGQGADPAGSFGGQQGLDSARSPARAAVAAGPAAGLPPFSTAAAGEFMGFSRPASDGGQIITLVNTSHPWMAVYHVDGSGQIILKGSRQLNQDFQFQYNAVAPLPEEIRRVTGP
ncbi:hypothetical protein [Roseimaritima sediminicola]|uniref:hypothetical protein n=1 Tax=Roseimaritima sediminicola TaxID=2662066 RepID=UPI0013874045|nr:hypothetical protein [Roseimaritima sediminicola]